jgi:molecular chaperone Hsp33
LDEPSGEFLAQVTSDGVVRAKQLPAQVPWSGLGRVTGTLVAVKSIPGRELYRGATSIQDESLEDALSRHLSDSHQVEAMLRLGTVDEPDGSLGFAGGLLVERLPPEGGLSSLDPVAFVRRFQGLAEGTPADHAVGAIYLQRLLGEPFLALERLPLVWRCRCSRERVRALLLALGREELQAMLLEQGEARVTCHFCNDEQVFDQDDLLALLAHP